MRDRIWVFSYPKEEGAAAQTAPSYFITRNVATR